VNQASSDISWRNGTWVANGNLVIRHLGIPTVTVPMGQMADTGMPIGLTFASKAYDDQALLRYAYAFERATKRRVTPPRTPMLADDAALMAKAVSPTERRDPAPTLTLTAALRDMGNATVEIIVAGETDAADLAIFVNGQRLEPVRTDTHFTARIQLPRQIHEIRHSEWRQPYGSILVAVARSDTSMPTARYAVVGGIA